MRQDFPADASPETRLEWLLEKFSKPLHQYCRSLTASYRDVLDPAEDADDLFVMVEMKIWTSYFAPNASRCFEYHSDAQSLSLLKKTAGWAVRDLVDKRQREYALLTKVNYLRPVELDAQLRRDLENGDTFADTTNSDSNTASEVEASIRVGEALAAACNSAREPGKALVVQFLLGQLRREELDYDDNYINVTSSRVRKAVRDYLAKV